MSWNLIPLLISLNPLKMQTSFLQDLKTCWPCPSVSHEWRHQAVRARVSSAVRWAQMPPTLTVCCKISIWEFLEGTGTRWNSANGTDCLFSVVAHEKLLAHSVTCEKRPVQGKTDMKQPHTYEQMCSTPHSTRISEWSWMYVHTNTQRNFQRRHSLFCISKSFPYVPLPPAAMKQSL